MWDKIFRAVTLVSLGGVGEVVLYQLDKRHPYGGIPEVDLIDYEDGHGHGHEHADPPPDGIEYADDDAPCSTPPQPWEYPDSDVSSLGNDAESCVLPSEFAPVRQTVAPFAGGATRPTWPVDTRSKRKLKVSYKDVRNKWHGRWGRHFGAKRKRKGGGGRVHVGVDLFADPGDVVLAAEGGTIMAVLPYYKGTGAIYVKHDSGLIVAYTEIEKGSWWDYGLRTAVGVRVEAGQPIARVGLTNDGSHMLHLETYRGDVTVEDIRKKKMQWLEGDPPPDGILDPTEYLVRTLLAKRDDIA